MKPLRSLPGVRRGISVFLLYLGLGPLLVDGSDITRPLAVIVHESSPVTSLSVAEFRKILLGETSEWPDGKRVVLVEREQASPVFRTALRLVCRMTALEYKRHLLSMEFQGGRVPLEKILNSDEAAAKFVRSVPGAIAVVENGSLITIQHVRVVRLGDKLPGEAGYILQ